MQVSGQLHGPAALLPLPTGLEACKSKNQYSKIEVPLEKSLYFINKVPMLYSIAAPCHLILLVLFGHPH
jgi:hypothetical protein